jgi:hypothetical protein
MDNKLSYKISSLIKNYYKVTLTQPVYSLISVIAVLLALTFQSFVVPIMLIWLLIIIILLILKLKLAERSNSLRIVHLNPMVEAMSNNFFRILESMGEEMEVCLVHRQSEVESTCAICLELIKVRNTITELDCGHSFHRDCCETWLNIKLECPVCKHLLLKKEGNKITISI